MNELADIIIRSSCVYFFMLIGIRIFGKNQLSQLNTGDVVLLLLISNAVQNAMVGPNTSLLGGVTAALILFVLNWSIKKLMTRSKPLKTLLEGEAIVLILDGKLNTEALSRLNLSEDEIQETIREHGVEQVAEVKLALLEVDGNISVITMSTNNTTQYTRHKRHNRYRSNF